MRCPAVVLSLVLVSSAAHAQFQIDDQELRGFRPPLEGGGALRSERAAVHGTGAYRLTMWLGYANRLLALESADDEEGASPLEHQWSMDYVAVAGVADGLDVGLALPTVVYQSGEGEDFLREPGLVRSAYGNLRVDVKSLLYASPSAAAPSTVAPSAPRPARGFSAASVARLILPTGTEGAYATETGAEFAGLAQWTGERVELRLSAGARFREPVQALQTTLGYVLPWSAAAAINLFPGTYGEPRVTLGAELFGEVGLRPEFAGRQGRPTSGAVSLQLLPDPWTLSLGAEAGLSASLGSPRFRTVASFGYAPRGARAGGGS